MKTGVIYMHRNLINNKVYIGQTIQKPEYRWNEGKGYKGSSLFYNAIQKYGWNNFQHLILEKDIPQNLLNQKEEYYIALYQSDNRNYGYNLTTGGYGCLTDQQQKRRKELLQKWRENNPEKYQKSITAMQKYWIEHPEEKQESLQKATKASIKWKKSHPQEVAKIMQKMQEKAKEKTCKKVQCIQTGIVYESAREADRQTGLKYYNISKVCNGKMKTTEGFHWKFYQEDN